MTTILHSFASMNAVNGQTYSYHELKHQVAQCAAGLKQAGITQGDRRSSRLTQYCPMPSSPCSQLRPSVPFGHHALLILVLIPSLTAFSKSNLDLSVHMRWLQYQGKRFETRTKCKSLLSPEDLVPSIGTSRRMSFFQKPIPQSSADTNSLGEFFKAYNTTIEFTLLPFNHPLCILFSSGTPGRPNVSYMAPGARYCNTSKN